jgi:hypothetical protein
MRATIRRAAGLAATLVAVVAAPGWAAQEATVKASAAWVGQGRFVPTGTGIAYFVGAFSGVLFVDNDQGPLNTGKILCPGTLEVDINGGKQRGEGRCLITLNPTDQIYAKWSCAGIHQVECKGSFTLTGGTGRFAGITGESEFRVRSVIAELVAHPGELVQETAAGLAEWPSLHYRIP